MAFCLRGILTQMYILQKELFKNLNLLHEILEMFGLKVLFHLHLQVCIQAAG